MATNFTEGDIREISVAGSPWCPDEIEITLVFDGLVCKNNYTPYVPERHGRLFADISLKEKLEILRLETSYIIANINSAVPAAYDDDFSFLPEEDIHNFDVELFKKKILK